MSFDEINDLSDADLEAAFKAAKAEMGSEVKIDEPNEYEEMN